MPFFLSFLSHHKLSLLDHVLPCCTFKVHELLTLVQPASFLPAARVYNLGFCSLFFWLAAPFTCVLSSWLAVHSKPWASCAWFSACKSGPARFHPTTNQDTGVASPDGTEQGMEGERGQSCSFQGIACTSGIFRKQQAQSEYMVYGTSREVEEVYPTNTKYESLTGSRDFSFNL
jgi:hypothetical protein